MFREFSPTDYKVMPWKNGGGSTTELFIEPGPNGFRWRVSIASVAEDGPFSLFSGYDRHIMTIAGAGMVLDCGEHGEIAVTPAFVPRQFSGDWATAARLVSGPARDFNLIVQRSYAQSSLECLRPLKSTILDGPGSRFVHLLAGSLHAESEFGSTVLTDGGSLLTAGTVALVPVPGAASPIVASCCIAPFDEH